MSTLNEQQAINYIRLLLDSEPQQRADAMGSLVEHNDERGIGPITRRLFDVDSYIRTLAVGALDAYGCGETASLAAALYTIPAQERRRPVINVVLDKLALLLQDDDNKRLHHHATILIGQLRLSSLLPCLVQAVQTENVFVRRSVAEAIWLIGGADVCPLACICSVDLDPIVRKFAAYTLAEAEDFALADNLCRDRDKKVRVEACRAFSIPGEHAQIIDNYRAPENAAAIYDPIYVRDESAPITLDRLVPLLTGLICHRDQRKDFAGVMAVIRAGDGEEFEILQSAYALGSQAAWRALQLYFGERLPEPPRPSLDSQTDTNTYIILGAISAMAYKPIAPSKRKPAKRQKALPHDVHPDLAEPFPNARVLIIGGDGTEATYRTRLASLGLQVTWQSGFDDKGKVEGKISSSDAVILVSHCMSHAIFEKAQLALKRQPDKPWGFSHGRGVVPVAQIIRKLLPVPEAV